MGKINDTATSIANDMETNKPLILTVVGIMGFVATAIEVAFAKPKADKVIEKRHENRTKEEKKIEELAKDILVAAPVYLPAVATGVASTLCITKSYKVSTERTAAYATAYTITEKKLKDYQSKVIETIGEKKEKAIQDEIAADKIKKNPPSDTFVINENETLCYDDMSGRYFRSDIEILRQAAARLSQRLYSEMYISLNEFYSEIGLPEIRLGDDLGWNVEDGIIELNFSSTLDDRNRPCLVVSYDISPRFDFRSLH